MIQGERVLIKETQKEDLESLRSLWNNGEVMKWVNFPNGLNMSIEKMKLWFEHIKNSEDKHHFVVYHHDQFCGELFYDVDTSNKRAGLDIKFMPKAQGKGLAVESLKLLIDHVFDNEPEVDTVWTEPSKLNKAARRLYTKCGLIEKNRPSDLGEGDTYWERNK